MWGGPLMWSFKQIMCPKFCRGRGFTKVMDDVPSSKLFFGKYTPKAPDKSGGKKFHQKELNKPIS